MEYNTKEVIVATLWLIWWLAFIHVFMFSIWVMVEKWNKHKIECIKAGGTIINNKCINLNCNIK